MKSSPSAVARRAAASAARYSPKPLLSTALAQWTLETTCPVAVAVAMTASNGADASSRRPRIAASCPVVDDRRRTGRVGDRLLLGDRGHRFVEVAGERGGGGCLRETEPRDER
ncbi:hypothetical protein [Streptomyces sp. NPDC059092]|uniref:hypothetical protein n=1 Tax=Streptomyces sp. NPDC059092 TaxID=3346725 RepID=UPI0036AA1C97